MSKRNQKRMILLGTGMGDNVSYDLRDEFTDTLAAGSVDGTSAMPGPGTRTVVDTNNKISVGSGVLDFASGVALNDGLWLDAVTRTTGRLMIASLNITSGGIETGWDSNQTGYAAPVFQLYSNVIKVNFSTVVSVGLYTNSTDYLFCVILRASGNYFLIKGGEYATWTLLYKSDTNNTASLYPTVKDVTGNFIGTADFIRIPTALWLPTPVAYDTFTRSNGAIGVSETAGPDGQLVGSRTWSAKLGTWTVASNAAVCSVLSGSSDGIATVSDSSNTDVLIGANLTRAGDDVGLVVRWADANNYIYALHNGTNAQLIKVVAGTPTTLINTAATYSAGARMCVRMMGTAARLYYNDALIGAQQTISDAGLQTGTNHGLYSTNTGNTFDNFELFPANSSYDGFLNQVTA